MKIKILGCDGGRGLGYNNTSLLFNETVLLDAGTIQSQISLEEALKIKQIFFSHTHLDHMVDLPFLLDATFNKRSAPLKLCGIEEAMEPMMRHVFNDEIWPNFSVLPTPEKGQFVVEHITPGEEYEVDGLRFTPIRVNHTVPTVGYLVQDKTSAIIFSGDTGPTEELWEVANSTPNLKAVIIDLSFPVSEQFIATISKHMTAADVASQLENLKVDCDVYAFHCKVGLQEILREEAGQLRHFGRPVKLLRDHPELSF